MTEENSSFNDLALRIRRYSSHVDLPSQRRLEEVQSLLAELDLLDRNITQMISRATAAARDSAFALRDQLLNIPDLPADVRARLKGYSSDHVVHYTTRYSGPPIAPNPHTGESLDDGLRMQVDATSFYYKAHRLLTVLGKMSGFKGVKCKEIAIVRNQLIEHPEGKDGRGEKWSFGHSGHEGPIFAAMGVSRAEPKHKDAGYIVNRGLLLDALSAALTKAEALE